MGGDVHGGTRGYHFTLEQKRVIASYYDAGATGTSIARALGVNARGVRAYLKRTGRLILPTVTRQERKSMPKATIRPNHRDLGWIAGFIEGEGTFNSRHAAYVGAVQVQREPLERLQRLCGGQIYAMRPSPKCNGRAQPSFGWRVCGARARGVMLTIFLLMSPRRKTQISRAMQRR